MSLELPTDSAPEEVKATAGASLRSQGIRTFSDLSLQTTLTTGNPDINRYTLTYWVDDQPPRLINPRRHRSPPRRT